MSLPVILSGPILRRTTPTELVIWLCTRQPLDLVLELYQAGASQPFVTLPATPATQHSVRIGEHAVVQLLTITPDPALPCDQVIEYDLVVDIDGSPQRLRDLLPHLVYAGQQRPSFTIASRIDHLLHGSCRKPHYPSPDALLRVDELIGQTLTQAEERPALLMMSGDQIYADDVAGPMLRAIHQVIDRLGLYSECLPGSTVANSGELYASDDSYYRRQHLLPQAEANEALRDRFFGGTRKPIFTTDSAHNHLISLAEINAMYLLIWAPLLWEGIDLSPPALNPEQQQLYADERPIIEAFAAGLAQVQRALAHLPVYMIFDDHDVTDDWNLSRGWEETAYGHPFSRRIIGNALIGYWLFQGWGNAPQRFGDDCPQAVRDALGAEGGDAHEALIDRLLHSERWHYSVPTTPKLMVLDTRTHRWWSENRASQPSGLMDWDELSDLQQALLDQPAVIMVSPAPIFGVKLIEIVQRIFTFFGYALMVDAENWMAHPGSANVILNIFRHRRTPQHFVILSGDVHYSFAYDIKARFQRNSPDIWQITVSGFKNEFPARLLTWFGRINRWLYASNSPLNWLTRRRRMLIRARRPFGATGTRLVNASATGQLRLDAEGRPTEISLLCADGRNIRFPPPQ
jgi:hypothetical protein